MLLPRNTHPSTTAPQQSTGGNGPGGAGHHPRVLHGGSQSQHPELHPWAQPSTVCAQAPVLCKESSGDMGLREECHQEPHLGHPILHPCSGTTRVPGSHLPLHADNALGLLIPAQRGSSRGHGAWSLLLGGAGLWGCRHLGIHRLQQLCKHQQDV